jgi:hypothetical protein
MFGNELRLTFTHLLLCYLIAYTLHLAGANEPYTLHINLPTYPLIAKQNSGTHITGALYGQTSSTDKLNDLYIIQPVAE